MKNRLFASESYNLQVGSINVSVTIQFDSKLEYARTMVPNTEVFLYEVDFKLKEYK